MGDRILHQPDAPRGSRAIPKRSGINVLFVSSEAVPFCKTGGLADVAGELPKALCENLPAGSRVLLCLPKYSAVDEKKFNLESLPLKLRVPVGDRIEEGSLFHHQGEIFSTYFIENKKLFARSGLYGEAGKDYPDNDERFAFFSRSALELCKALGFFPDVVHGHDWQTGLIPAYLKTLYASEPLFQGTGSLFTIHNIAYQGIFPKESLPLTGLGWDLFTPEKIEYYGSISYLKAGLIFADKLNTVSPRYAKEIQSSEKFGRGMEGVLKSRSKDLSGILNGLDEKTWNPSLDPWIASKYSPKEKDWPRKKNLCKLDLQKLTGLKKDRESPLIGTVSRLDPQKGFKMVTEILPKVCSEHPSLQAVILGTGAPDIEKDLLLLSQRFPGRVAFEKGFNDPLAHKIYAGSDLFLMPSEFEPCGLGQMIAMKYGTAPVVTQAGGLMDTVTPWNPKTRKGTGFVCSSISSPALHQALWTALKCFEDKAGWKVLAKHGMTRDFSWRKSAAQYVKLYKTIMNRHPRVRPLSYNV